jgi:hypothetical protein
MPLREKEYIHLGILFVIVIGCTNHLLTRIILDIINSFLKVNTIANEASFNYFTFAILMLTLFGFLGTVYAFLLKFNEIHLGYEIDLPSNIRN